MQAVTADDGFRRAGFRFLFFKRFMGVGSLRLTKERFFAGAVGGGVLVRKNPGRIGRLSETNHGRTITQL